MLSPVLQIAHLGLATSCCKSWLPAAATDSPQTELSVDSIGSVPPTLLSPAPSAPPRLPFLEPGHSCVRVYSSYQPIGPQPFKIPQKTQLPTRSMICWTGVKGRAGWFMAESKTDPSVEERRLRYTPSSSSTRGKEGPREPRLFYGFDQMWLRGSETFVYQ